MAVIEVHLLIHGLSHCCSQLHLPTLQSRRQCLSILSSVIFTIIVPPSISAITVISTVFLLPEITICHYVHLNQPLTLGDIPFLLILSFGGILSLYTFFFNDSNRKTFWNSLHKFICVNDQVASCFFVHLSFVFLSVCVICVVCKCDVILCVV